MLLGMAHPSYGRAELLGHDVAVLSPEVRGRIAYLAEGHPLYGWMSVIESIRFRRAFHRQHWNESMLSRLLDQFRLPFRMRVRRLSLGQRAQLALALAIAADPDLLILDDPTLGLDTVARHDFLMSSMRLIRREGRTIFFSSHILSDVERVADRIGILIDGTLRADCPTGHFKDCVRRVIVEFRGEPPDFPECAGLVDSRAIDRRLELVFVQFGEPQRRLIESLSPDSWNAVEMNLEDAFVAYTRNWGSKVGSGARDEHSAGKRGAAPS